MILFHKHQFADAEVEKAGKFPKYNKQIVTLNKQITVSQSSGQFFPSDSGKSCSKSIGYFILIYWYNLFLLFEKILSEFLLNGFILTHI